MAILSIYSKQRRRRSRLRFSQIDQDASWIARSETRADSLLIGMTKSLLIVIMELDGWCVLPNGGRGRDGR